MTIPAPRDRVEELTVGGGARLEELVDRESLAQLAASFADLSGVGVRVFDAEGKLLADAALTVELISYLVTLRQAKIAVESTVATAFVALASAGVTGSAWLLVAGYAGHGIKDFWQHRTRLVANTRWWPPFCATVDWVAAAVLAAAITTGVDFR